MHRRPPAASSVTFLLLLAFSSLLTTVFANTEIQNFDVIKEGIDELGWLTLKFKGLDRIRLNANVSERNFLVEPAPLGVPLDRICEQKSSNDPEKRTTSRCPHEVWVQLDLEEEAWSSFSKFTLRASWPAFYPTEFDIKIFSSSEALRSFDSDNVIPKPASFSSKPLTSTGKMYARIRLVDTGVRNPSHQSTLDTVSNEVPFTLKLEPLHFGLLPESIIPTILAILLVSGVTFFFVVPRVVGAFEVKGRKAAKELASSGSTKKNQ